MTKCNTFIHIRKRDIIEKLRELKIRDKYYNKICDGVKELINQSLNDFILESIEQNTIIQGQTLLIESKPKALFNHLR